MQRERRLAGSPPSFAESPLAAIWGRAADGRHALAAGNVACIREAHREEERQPRPRWAKRVPVDGGEGVDGFWNTLLAESAGRIAAQRAF